MSCVFVVILLCMCVVITTFVPLDSGCVGGTKVVVTLLRDSLFVCIVGSGEVGLFYGNGACTV